MTRLSPVVWTTFKADGSYMWVTAHAKDGLFEAQSSYRVDKFYEAAQPVTDQRHMAIVKAARAARDEALLSLRAMWEVENE